MEKLLWRPVTLSYSGELHRHTGSTQVPFGAAFMWKSIFGARQAVPPTGPVSSIVVRQSAYDSDEQTRIVSGAVDFVNAMVDQGVYLRSELPPNAMRIYYTDYYLAQVVNGGHGQFVGNSRWEPNTIRDITEGLAAMNAEPYRSIFAELRRLIESDEALVKAIAAGRGFMGPDLKALDAKFYKQRPYKIFSPMIAQWLRSLPELEVVPDASYAQRLQALCDANPQRTARLAVRKEHVLKANLVNPIWVAARLLCLKAGYMPVLAIGGGDPGTVAPDGEKLTGWHVQTAKGRKVLQIGKAKAYLCDTYLADGTLLTDELMAQARQQLQAGQSETMSRFATMTQREIASIPMSEVQSAKDAASKTPAVLIARLLLERLGTGEHMTHVYASAFHASGQWLWLVETEKRIAMFGLKENRFVLCELGSQAQLASVSLGDVRAAVENEPSGRA